MALDPRTPVVVGVGQVMTPADAALDPAERPEPLELMAMALRAAAEDCDGVAAGRRRAGGHALIRQADSIRVVVPLGWHSVNPALLVAERLGFAEGDEPAELMLSAIGGNTPQALMHDACRGHQPRRPRRRAGHRGRGHVHPRAVPARPGQAAPDLGEPAGRGHAARRSCSGSTSRAPPTSR